MAITARRIGDLVYCGAVSCRRPGLPLPIHPEAIMAPVRVGLEDEALEGWFELDGWEPEADGCWRKVPERRRRRARARATVAFPSAGQRADLLPLCARCPHCGARNRLDESLLKGLPLPLNP